jgi:hypothetical protein
MTDKNRDATERSSVWLECLDENKAQDYFQESVGVQCEEVLSAIQNQLKQANPDMSLENARHIASCLMLQQVLSLTNKHAPGILDNMAVDLFLGLPGLYQYKKELFAGIVDYSNGVDIDDMKFSDDPVDRK